MKRSVLLASGAVLTLATGTVVAATASATTTTHKLTLVGTMLQQTQLGKSHETEADLLRLPSPGTSPTTHKPIPGKKQGYSSESCFFGSTSDRCSFTLALKGGFLYGHYVFPITNGIATTTARGKITGGLGSYANATGTVRINATTKSETWKITYTK
jgi:hypothetical protein